MENWFISFCKSLKKNFYQVLFATNVNDFPEIEVLKFARILVWEDLEGGEGGVEDLGEDRGDDAGPRQAEHNTTTGQNLQTIWLKRLLQSKMFNLEFMTIFIIYLF